MKGVKRSSHVAIETYIIARAIVCRARPSQATPTMQFDVIRNAEFMSVEL